MSEVVKYLKMFWLSELCVLFIGFALVNLGLRTHAWNTWAIGWLCGLEFTLVIELLFGIHHAWTKDRSHKNQ